MTHKIKPVEGDYSELDLEIPYGDRPELAETCYKIVEYWMEDYSFEELLEEFNTLPEEVFYVLVRTGLINEDDLQAYLVTE